MAALKGFPKYGECAAKGYIDDLSRLVTIDLFKTKYMDARAAAKLLAVALSTYRNSRQHARWTESDVLRQLRDESQGRTRTFNLVCAALFDLLCNAEYIRNRVVTSDWIYCRRDRAGTASAHVYYSFLKQCPRCCQDIGLDKRLSGAQHKPSSHHIGEITTTAIAFFLTLLGRSCGRPLTIGVNTKQSHDVDAVAWRDDLLVLFEIKASPLVTYPLRAVLSHPYTQASDEGPVEVPQHSLKDVNFRDLELGLYLANKDKDLNLGKPVGTSWPYEPLTALMADPENLLDYIEAWGEIFHAYSIPKTSRTGRDVVLGYLANGWGDEIDSNKTKAGLGRTDDIKKGTYQLLKFGAYYRNGSPSLPVRGALVANLDPVFLYQQYIEKLIDARWAPAAKFSTPEGRPEIKEIYERDLFYIYDALLAFNTPVVNDPMLAGCFDFAATETALVNGALDSVLQDWQK